MKNMANSDIVGLSTKTNLSYFNYLKAGLEVLSSRLSIRVYKLAPKIDYPIFERGKDLRVKIFWDKDEKYEFIIENSFFYQRNSNKEDRSYMRSHANIKLIMFKDAIQRGKNEEQKKKIQTT
jgi:hypothetical protein